MCVDEMKAATLLTFATCVLYLYYPVHFFSTFMIDYSTRILN